MLKSVTPEQVKELRKIIDQQLRSKDVYNQIRELLSDYLNMDPNRNDDVHSEEHVSCPKHCYSWFIGASIFERKRSS